MNVKNVKQHWWLLISFLLAIPIGLLFGDQVKPLEYLGTAFINLLKMVIVPLVTFSIINALAKFEKSGDLRRLGLKTTLYYMGTSLVAILLGLVIFNIVNPGRDVNLPFESEEEYQIILDRPESLLDLIVNIIPDNPFRALADMNMLNIIFFSILFGIALSHLPNRKLREHFLTFSESVYEIMVIITNWIVKLIPLGIFGLVIKAINQADVDFFTSVLKYVLTLASGLLIHLLIIQPVILYLFTGRPPYKHFRHMSEAILTVLATASSLATLPVTMKCVREKANVSPTITNFVIPLGATVNMDGAALFECVGALFVAQVLGFELSFAEQFIVVLTALLASIGAAGIPSGGIVVIFIVLNAVGLSGPTSDFIVGIMLAVDRPLDLLRGVVNIFGDSVGAVVIDESEKKEVKHSD